MTFALKLQGKSELGNNAIVFLQQDSSQNKLSLLKKLSEALKFRKHAREKERIRVIQLIDEYIKMAELAPGSSKFSIASINNKLATLQTMICKIQSDLENDKPSPPIPDPKPIPDIPEPAPAPIPAVVNNDKYIDELIKAIMSGNQPAIDAPSQAKQERLALIKNLILQPIVLKDTLNKVFERERSVKLKHAAEVWGFFPYTNRAVDLNYRVFNTLVINAYELNGRTGRSQKNLDLKNFEVSRRAKLMGSKLIIGVTADAANTSNFLQQGFAQNQFLTEITSALLENDLDGVNIQFKGLNARLSMPMLAFINRLSTACRKGNKKFILSITLPDFDLHRGYDLAGLAPLTDRFLIDFSQPSSPNLPGPLAPLKQQSDYSIETCVSRYLNASNLSPSKLILLLPFYGIKREFDPKGKAKNPIQLSYSKIRANYQFLPVNYDDQTATAIIEILDTAGKLREKIWFDNEHTLAKKFDFALQGGLAGVAIRDMIADIGYGELSDELAYKFLLPDTITTKLVNLELKNQKFGWAYIIRNLRTYYEALGNPCQPTKDAIDRTLLTWINIILIVICSGLGIFCYHQMRTKGDGWINKKPMLIITSIISFILITCAFAWLYLDQRIPWFGMDKACIDMPFLVLYLIILSGIAIGILLMRLLLFPIVRQEDTP